MLARAFRDGAPIHQLHALAGSVITIGADADRAHATVDLDRNSTTRHPAKVTPAKSTTKCYAAGFNDCKGGISREHYLSANILKQIGEMIEVSGYPWLAPAEVKSVSVKALTAKILCKCHNSALSPLDTLVGDVFRTLKNFDAQLAKTAGGPAYEKLSISGPDFERWLVKVYCGMHYGGQLRLDEGQRTSVPQYLLDNLFKGTPLPMDLGFYFGAPLGTQIATFNGTRVTTAVIPGTREVVGMTIALRGFEFMVSLRPATAGGTGLIAAPAQRHPVGLRLDGDGGRSRELAFEWPVAKA